MVERVDITRAVMEEGVGKIAELANAILCGEKASSLGPVDKLIGPEARSGDVYEAEIAC